MRSRIIKSKTVGECAYRSIVVSCFLISQRLRGKPTRELEYRDNYYEVAETTETVGERIASKDAARDSRLRGFRRPEKTSETEE